MTYIELVKRRGREDARARLTVAVNAVYVMVFCILLILK